jgi:hypothetical protein
MPTYTTVDEPYHLMEEDGHEFSHPPSIDDFEAQLERAIDEKLRATWRAGPGRSCRSFVAVPNSDGFVMERAGALTGSPNRAAARDAQAAK